MLSKLQFVQQQMHFLGKDISAEGKRLSADIVSAIQKIPKPDTKKLLSPFFLRYVLILQNFHPKLFGVRSSHYRHGTRYTYHSSRGITLFGGLCRVDSPGPSHCLHAPVGTENITFVHTMMVEIQHCFARYA